MNAQVVCCISGLPSKPYYFWKAFNESLRRFAEVPTVLGWEVPGAWNGGMQRWNGLNTKPFLYRNWLRAGLNTSDRLILTDCYDVVFQKHPHDVGDRCAEFFGEDAIVFNAEKSLFPRGDLQEKFDAIPLPKMKSGQPSPWAYLNSGFICGPADAILTLIESMDLESIGLDRDENWNIRKNANGGDLNPNDQGEFQQAFFDAAGKVKMVLDSGCQVAQTMSSCDISEFDFTTPLITNIATGTVPGVIHCNGGAKNDIMPHILAKFDLPVDVVA